MEFKNRTASTPDGALARLWRTVIKDNALEHGLEFLVTRYTTRASGTGKNIKRKTRSIILADITANEMTWKKFTHIIFHLLGAIRMDVTIKITYPNSKTSIHTVGIKSTDNENISARESSDKGE